jgi:hypothetical protein
MELRLTADDYNLILESTQLSPAPEVALRAGVVEGMFLRFEMAPEVGSELLVDMMNAALASTSRRHRLVLERLIRKVTDELSDEGLAFAQDPLHLVRRSEQYNREPREELGGFSPHAVRTLLDHDWRPGSPGLQLREDVPPQLLARSAALHDARLLLTGLAPHGTPATSAGNLNRAFVDEMVATMRWRDQTLDDERRHRKIINEHDVRRLHELRLILELAELIVSRRTRFSLTDRGRELAAAERMGALFALLFETTFRTFNLGYHDRLPDLPAFQSTIAFPLAVIAQEPAGWCDYETLVPRLVLPAVDELIPEDDFMDYRECMLNWRLIERLAAFGLVDLRYREDQPKYLPRPARLRRTPLFDRFLHFELD